MASSCVYTVVCERKMLLRILLSRVMCVQLSWLVDCCITHASTLTFLNILMRKKFV